MKLKWLMVVILLGGFVVGCKNDKIVVGNWYYTRVSSKNGARTELTFHLNSDYTCSYDMEYTFYGEKIIDETNECTWEMDGDYVWYYSNVDEGKLFYDKDNDVLYTIDKDTGLNDYEMERQ